MKEPFRYSLATTGKRPIIEFGIRGFPSEKRLSALVDSGSNVTYIDDRIADVLGLRADPANTSTSDVGGSRHVTFSATLTLFAGLQEWESQVLFASGWNYDFQLLGLADFFHLFRVDVDAQAQTTSYRPRRYDGRVRRVRV